MVGDFSTLHKKLFIVVFKPQKLPSLFEFCLFFLLVLYAVIAVI